VRALKAAALLVLVAVCAVVGFRLATAHQSSGRPDAAPRSSTAPTTRSAQETTRTSRDVVPPSGTTLTITTAGGRRILSTTVGRYAPVRRGGNYAPVDPPHWNQAVWVRYRPLVPPVDTARGTSYVYGHACHHHVCAFTRLTRAGRGDVITVRRGSRTVRYTIVRTSADFPKSGPRSLANRDTSITDRTVRHRLVLITCAYETGDLSLNDLVVVAVRRGPNS